MQTNWVTFKNLKALLVDQHNLKNQKIRILCPQLIYPLVTWIYLIFLQHYRAYIALNSGLCKPVFEEKSKKIMYLFSNKIGFWKKSLKVTDWFRFWTYIRQSIYVVRTIIHNQKWCVLMCAMQCTTLIETCSQCTNSSIFNLNLPSKLAGMQVLQNGHRFGSTRTPKISKNFVLFFITFLNQSVMFLTYF